MQKSYNQVIELLGAFAVGHPQVNSHSNGFKTDINQFLKDNDQLAFLFFEPLSITLNDNTQDLRFRIYCLDFKQKDNDGNVGGNNLGNTQDVLSDTAQILTDLRKYLISNFESNDIFSIQFNSDTLIPVNNWTADYCVGWYMDITISSALIQSDCDIPGFTTLCPPVKYFINEQFINESFDNIFIVVKDTEGNEVGELIEGEWIVPVGGCAFPITLKNTQECDIATINECPQSGIVILPNFQLIDNTGNVGSLPIPQTITFNGTISSTSIDGCGITLTPQSPFPILITNRDETCLLGVINSQPTGPFLLQNAAIQGDEGVNQPLTHSTSYKIIGGEIDTITYAGCAATINLVPTPPPCFTFPFNLVNTNDVVLDTITECPEGNEIQLTNIPLVTDGGTTNYPVPTQITFDGELSTVLINAGTGEMTLIPVPCPSPNGIAYADIYPIVQHPKTGLATPTTNSSCWLFEQGHYDRTNPVYPVSYAKLDHTATQAVVRVTPATGTLSTDLMYPTILESNNAFGNRFRFTDSIGNPSDATVGSYKWAHIDWIGHSWTGAIQYYVIDHLTGDGYWVQYVNDGGVYNMQNTANGDSWTGWLTRISNLTLGGFNDWVTLDACSIRPHFNRVNVDEGGNANRDGWCSNFFEFEPSQVGIYRGSMFTGEELTTTQFWTLYDSGNAVQLFKQNKVVGSGFPERITNIFPMRKHY